MSLFHLQGHRGARGLRPENTLPSFEAALDCGVNSVETDLHRTRDGAIVLYHDFARSGAVCRAVSPPTDSRSESATIRDLTLSEIRRFVADHNPHPDLFPEQQPSTTPLSHWFADERGFAPYAIPTLADLFTFVAAYAGEPGARFGKSDGQRERAGRLVFDLEIKRLPFEETDAGPLIEALLESVRAAELVGRVVVRSFDHRIVREARRREPELTGGVLVAGTAPVDPVDLARKADAQIYCPDYRFLDAEQVRALRSEGVRVLPWTANEPEAWARLVEWGVDGITTDYPDRLGAWLRERGLGWG